MHRRTQNIVNQFLASNVFIVDKNILSGKNQGGMQETRATVIRIWGGVNAVHKFWRI